MLNGNTVEERIWNYLYSKIGNAYGVAGLMGNLKAESGLIFNRVEILCLKRLKENGKVYTDSTYTAAIDNGTISRSEFLNPLPNKQYGYGLWQLTSPSRKAGLYDLVKKRGVSIADEEAQLDYLMTELKGNYNSVLSVLKSATSVKIASDMVLKKFECPADTGFSVQATRASYGQSYYNKYAKNSSGGTKTISSIVQNVINDAVDFAVKMANDNTHGYSQTTRSLYNITNPTSFDCSSLVCTAYYYAFIKNKLTALANYLKSNCSYTGNMLKMVNCGFEIVAQNQTAHASMQKGDIELNQTYHTALAIDADNIVHARSSEGMSDTKDNSGNEIRTQAWYLYSHGWTHRLRFTGKGVDLTGVTAANITTSGNTSGTTSQGKSSYNKTEKYVGVVTADSLNVRKNAGTSYGTCTFSPLAEGTEISVCDTVKDSSGKTWLYIKYKNKYGFVHGDYVSKKSVASSSSSSSGWVGEVNASILNVRKNAGTENAILSAYPHLGKGNKIRVLSEVNASDGSKWYKIAINNANTGNKDVIGYVSASYIKKV